MLRYVRTNLVGFPALFVALGGTGYAALKLPKHSVSQRALKTGAVISRVVKNHTIRASDLSRGLSLAGPPGPAGSQGAQGAQGPKGDRGDLGPTEGGSSDLPPLNLSSEENNSQTQFTTTRAGKVLVAKTLSEISVSCSTGPWAIWLQVDGTRVPGSIDSFNASGSTLHALTLTGVTSDVLAAGLHTASFGVDCISGNEASSSSASNQDLTWALLGSG